MSAKALTAAESERIASKLSHVVHMFRALHRLALTMEIEDMEEAEMVSTLSMSVAKDGVRVLDACLVEMGSFASGDFRNEFEEIAPNAGGTDHAEKE